MKSKTVIDEYNDTRLLSEMTLKSIRIIQYQEQVSDIELQRIIDYFQNMEYYVICDKLRNHKN